MCFYFMFTTTRTDISGDQPALLHVELLRYVDLPFVVAVSTKRLALVLFFEGRFAKWNDVSHN